MVKVEQPKRRRFQFHLSTAVAMMVVAGIYVALNFWGRQDTLPPGTLYTEYGCIFTFVNSRGDGTWEFSWIALFVNLCILPGLLGITWFISERLCRRKAECPTHAFTLPTVNRRWLQFHLITALAMMVVAGVFVGLNAVPHGYDASEPVPLGEPVIVAGSSPDIMLLAVSEKYGFPYQFFKTGVNHGFQSFDWLNLAKDLSVLLLLLGITWFVSEWWIRRRAE
jgi:uncharacterized membrane protein